MTPFVDWDVKPQHNIILFYFRSGLKDYTDKFKVQLILRMLYKVL